MATTTARPAAKRTPRSYSRWLNALGRVLRGARRSAGADLVCCGSMRSLRSYGQTEPRFFTAYARQFVRVSQSLTCCHPGRSGRCVSSAHAIVCVSASNCCRYSRGSAAGRALQLA